MIRLVGAILAEQHVEWIEGRRYLGLDVLSRSRITPVPEHEKEETRHRARRTQRLRSPRITGKFETQRNWT